LFLGSRRTRLGKEVVDRDHAEKQGGAECCHYI
jgi:hypothetical protein